MRSTVLYLTTLISVATSITISCEFKILSKRPFIGEQYRCLVSGMNFETSCTNIKVIEGEHLPDLTSDDVISFKIDHKTCFYVPRGLDRFFKNIKGIEIIRSKLREVTQSDLKPFADLKIADFRNNKITALEPNLFAFNSNLDHVDFSGNQIMFIASGLFDLIDDLKSVYLSRNWCITKSAVGKEDIERIKEEIVMKCNSELKYVTKPRIIELAECQGPKQKYKVIEVVLEAVTESPLINTSFEITTTEASFASTSEMTSVSESNPTDYLTTNEVDVTEQPVVTATEAPQVIATDPSPINQSTPTEIFDLKKLVEKLLKGVEVPSIFITNSTSY